MNYYNDNDPFACAWLEQLARAGVLSSGIIDPRPIQDVCGSDLGDTCHFFAGIGGWPLALQLAGWPADRSVWTGSCPCQPFSAAGKRLGVSDDRHLWPEFRRLIAECRPATIFGEQVAGRAGREWFAGVRADLEALGYAVGAADLCAASVGAPHIRQRLFWVAFCDAESKQIWRAGQPRKNSWRLDAGARPLVDGLSARLERVRGYGNAIVPQVAAAFIRAFMLT